LIWAYLYNLTVSHMGDVNHVSFLPWTFDVSLALSGIIGGTTQAFFTYRVYRISRQMWLACPAWIASVGRAVISVVLTVVSIQGGTLAQLRAKYDVVVYIALVVSVSVDIWNSAALCYYLKSKKTDQTTSGVVNSIVLWSIETGLATTVAAVLVLVCWSAMPNNGLWLCFFFIYSKRKTPSLLLFRSARGLTFSMQCTLTPSLSPSTPANAYASPRTSSMVSPSLAPSTSRPRLRRPRNCPPHDDIAFMT
jgi:hypothetical protein